MVLQEVCQGADAQAEATHQEEDSQVQVSWEDVHPEEGAQVVDIQVDDTFVQDHQAFLQDHPALFAHHKAHQLF